MASSSSGDFHASLRARGKGAKNWANSWTEVEYLGADGQGKDVFATRIATGHKVFKDKADGQWKKHKLTDERPIKDYVLLQSAKCCVEIYPYYAKIFDVNHEEVRLHEERWVIQRLFQEPDTWRDVDAYNPIVTVEEVEDSVTATITYDSDYGSLVVKYIQKDGMPLKHEIVFTNTTASTETFRVLQRWAGIAGNKCNKKTIPHTIETAEEAARIDFQKEDGSFTLGENLWNMIFDPDIPEVGVERRGGIKLDQCLQRPITVESHAQGMKVDFIYGFWTLNQYDFLEIDPYTYSNADPAQDGDIKNDLGVYTRDSADTLIVIRHNENGKDAHVRGYIDWVTSGIPDAATVTLVEFRYEATKNEADCHIHQRSDVYTEADATVWSDCNDGTVYADPAGFPVVGVNQSVDLGANAISDLEGGLLGDWFAIGITRDVEAGTEACWIVSENGAGTPDPTLYVEYFLTASAELLAKFEIPYDATVELLGRAEITHSVELLGRAVITRAAELLGKFCLPIGVELLGRAVITHSEELLARAVITRAVELLAKFCCLPFGIEDIGAYTEIDPDADITKSCNRITWTSMRRDSRGYTYKTYSPGFFTDFEFKYTVNITDVESGDVSNRLAGGPILLTTKLGTFNNIGGAGESYITPYVQQNANVDDQFKWIISQISNGASDGSDTGAVRGTGIYYLTWGRAGTLIYLKVYSDAARTDLLDDLSFIGVATGYAHIQIATAGEFVDDPADHYSGYLENLDLQSNVVELLARAEITRSAELLGRAVITRAVELLARIVITRSEELLARFEAQATAELLGRVVITHSIELLGRAVITRAVELPSKFVVGQSSEELYARFQTGQQSAELFARFEAQDTAELFGRIDAVLHPMRWPAELLGKFDVGLTNTYDELFSILEVEHSTILELLCEFEVGHSSFSELLARSFVYHLGLPELLGEFIVQNEDSAEVLCNFAVQSVVDLLGKFRVGPPKSSDGFLVCNDVSSWINVVTGVGEGFISMPLVEGDVLNRICGNESARLTSYYTPHQYKEIRFGWDGTCRGDMDFRREVPSNSLENLFAESIIRQIEAMDLPAEMILRGSDFADEIFSKLEVGQGFNELSASFQLVEADYSSWTNVWCRDYGAGVDIDRLIVDNEGRVYAWDSGNVSAYMKDYAGGELNTPLYTYWFIVKDRSASETGKYVLGVPDATLSQFDVWRYGTIVFGRDSVLDEVDANSVQWVAISPNGRYIAIIADSIATGNLRYILLYEGS